MENQPWIFDSAIADIFLEHARQNIPGYDEVVELCVDVVRAHCSPVDRIAEIGCATGHTLRKLENAGYCNVVGVDSSDAMLQRCAGVSATLRQAERFPVEDGPFQAVLMNWTLHFVSPGQREAYLSSLVSSLVPGGVLVLTEKTCQSSFSEGLYEAFKKRQGMTPEAIEEKRKRLAGVLETVPYEWYVKVLAGLGLQTEILWAKYGFVTFLARNSISK